ncbi:MAG: methionine--tRNA ligase subunit beta, partial [Pseudomonadota bacterium]|nr:methionine--tRNA ligase subunit beta [Pseudomonadota bacterium]
LDVGLDPEALRYYFATKSAAGVDDLDLNLEDFTARVNSDLVGKFVNLASRASGFATRHFDGQLNRHLAGTGRDRVNDTLASADSVRQHYAAGDFAAVARECMHLCDLLNQRWDEAKPWLLAKDPEQAAVLQRVCSECLLGFYVVSTYLLPILPGLCTRALALFGRVPAQLEQLLAQLPDRILPYQPLLTRIDLAQVKAMIEASMEDLKPSTAQPAPIETAPTIGIEDFSRLDLRIGTVLECALVEGSDKLLRFRLDAGELGQRQIFSGIRAGYPDAASLVGRQVVFIANLAPRKMRFGMSEGMILSAGFDAGGLFLLDADAGAQPGMPVR